MEKKIEDNKKVTRQQKIVPKVTVVALNEPNFELMAQAYIDFHHKTKHYLKTDGKELNHMHTFAKQDPRDAINDFIDRTNKGGKGGKG